MSRKVGKGEPISTNNLNSFEAHNGVYCQRNCVHVAMCCRSKHSKHIPLTQKQMGRFVLYYISQVH